MISRLGQCQTQIKSLNVCLAKETERLKQKELELRQLVETGKIPDSITAKAKAMAEETRAAEERVTQQSGKRVGPISADI
jgi:hypothetical protein